MLIVRERVRMRGYIKELFTKLLAMILAIFIAIPSQIFASQTTADIGNKYTEDTSVMGLGNETETGEDQSPKPKTSSKLLSDESITEADDYTITESSSLSKATGRLTYKIILEAKTPVEESLSENLLADFAIEKGYELSDLKIEKVNGLDKEGNETEADFKEASPNILTSNPNIETLAISTNQPQYGLVYYLSAKVDEKTLANIEETDPTFAIDMSFVKEDKTIVATDRYAIELAKEDESTDITINDSGEIVEDLKFDLVEVENPTMITGEYKEESQGIFSKSPATIVWTDYILSSSDKEFTYDFKIDDAQDANSSKIKIDFFEATDKGFVLNNSFTQELPYTNSLNLQVPQGQLAKVELITNVKNGTNPKVFTFNNKEITNPAYTEEAKKDETEESSTDDEDPLPESKENKADTKASKEVEKETDTKKETTIQAPQASAITLNKDAYIESIADAKDATNITKASNQIAFVLESYNNEEIEWEDFVASVQTITKAQNIDQAQTEDILSSLTAGLNEDKYKVASIDIAEAIGVDTDTSNTNTKEENLEPTVEEGAELPSDKQKTVDELVKEKLADPNTTLEDFQNYMYELEEKYNLTNEDIARTYGDNDAAIKALVEKHKDTNLDPKVLAGIINANRHTIDRDWSEDEGLREALNQYQLAIYGYGNPVIEDENITSIDWNVTYYSDKPLSTQGLLASITAVEGSGIDTDGITGIKVNGEPITLASNPADGEHGINDSYYSDLSNQGKLREYKIEFSTPVTEKQDYYTLDFFGQYNNVKDKSLKDRKPRGSARLTSPGYIDAQKTKDNPDASFADNKQTVRGYYTDLVDGKPSKARWIVTDHVTTQNERTLPFDTRNLTNQDLESLKVSFYTPDENGKLVKLGETEDLTKDYPLSQGSLLTHPPLGTIAVYEYITNLKDDPYETEYALGDTKLGDLTKEFLVKKEWQDFNLTNEIPVIDVVLTGSDNKTEAKGRLPGNIDSNGRENITITVPSWTLSQDTNGNINYEPISFSAREELVSGTANFTNVGTTFSGYKDEVDLINRIIDKTTPGSLSIQLLDEQNDEPIDGVEFILKGPDFEKVSKTDSKGQIYFDRLPEEKIYTLMQKDAKTGYRKPLEMGHITVDRDGNVTWTPDELIASGSNTPQNPTLTIYNDKLSKAEFKIKKIKEDGSSLAGAAFSIKDKDGNLISSGVSADDGYINFSNLTAGLYTLEETSAPDEYDISDKVYDVSIDESNYIEVRDGDKIIAEGYPENMHDEFKPSAETKVNVTRNEYTLVEHGFSGGTKSTLDRLRFETLTHNLEMNVQNPKVDDEFSIDFDEKLNLERNISEPLPDIRDDQGRLVAKLIDFDKENTNLTFKFDPKYIEPGQDINISYQIKGIRPDDYRVRNEYGTGEYTDRPAKKDWTFTSDLVYGNETKDHNEYDVPVDMASGLGNNVYHGLDYLGSHVVDIKRKDLGESTSFTTVFYYNPVPGKVDKKSGTKFQMKVMMQGIDKTIYMEPHEIVSGELSNSGFERIGSTRVYRIPDNMKKSLMPTSYGVVESDMQSYLQDPKTYTNSGRDMQGFSTITLSGLDKEQKTDGFIIVADFKVTDPSIVDNNFIALELTQPNSEGRSRGFFMLPGGVESDASAITNSIPTPPPFSLEIPNEKYLPGSFKLLKKDSENNNPLSGAVFTLCNENQSQIIDQKRTGTDGKISFTNLRPGTYKLVETKSPDGYVKEDQVASVIVGKDGKVAWLGNNLLDNADSNAGQTNPLLSVTNKAKDYQVTIHKVNKDGTPLSNASFTLYDGPGEGANSITSSDKTNDSGELMFKNLEAGKDYYLKEETAPQGYIKLNQVLKFSIDKDGRITNSQTLDKDGNVLTTASPFIANVDGIGTIRVANKANEISFQKMAVSNLGENPLSGIEFTLKNTSDNSKVSTRSDENGKIRFEKILDGDYELIETIPEPATENNGIKTFTIDGKKYNAPSDGIVARFNVKDGQINSIKSWTKTTDATGSASIGLIDVEIDDFENTLVQVDNESGDKPTYPMTGFGWGFGYGLLLILI